MENRRRRRGDTLETALSYQLAACVEDEGLAAMVLADDEGLCMASWGGRDVCEDAAARAPLPGERRLGAEAARRVRFGGIDLFLCAVGGEPRGRIRSLERSASGVTRILASWIAPS
jgi:hypothetical protein